MKKKDIDVNWFFVFIFIVLFILIYLGSLGQVNINIENNKVVKDDLEGLSKLKIRHQKLKILIEKKELLSKKLKKRFKLVYIAVRLLFASIFLGYNAILYSYFEIQKLGDLLNWNEFALIVVAFISFISFGTLSCLKDFLENVKMKLEVWVFSKYVTINNEIQIHKVEVKQIAVNIINNTQSVKTIELTGDDEDQQNLLE